MSKTVEQILFEFAVLISNYFEKHGTIYDKGGREIVARYEKLLTAPSPDKADK